MCERRVIEKPVDVYMQGPSELHLHDGGLAVLGEAHPFAQTDRSRLLAVKWGLKRSVHSTAHHVRACLGSAATYMRLSVELETRDAC